jgi:hypothetical protein
MPAQIFNIPTTNTKFSGFIDYRGSQFQYDIYFVPFSDESEKEEAVKRITTRIRYLSDGSESICLGLTKDIIEDMLSNQDISAFVFVKEQGTNDEASGTLQIYNWCNKSKKKTDAQVWINDVCRFTHKDSAKSSISPVKVLFIIFEQLSAHLAKRKTISLMVEQSQYNVLGPLYKNSYGFSDVNNCPQSEDYNVLRKSITADPKYADFPFVTSNIAAGIKKNKKISKHKSKKRNNKKTIKNKK